MSTNQPPYRTEKSLPFLLTVRLVLPKEIFLKCVVIKVQQAADSSLFIPTRKTLEKPFYGVYYGQAALPIAPEEMNYLTGGAIDTAAVYNYETDTEGGIYDAEKAAGRDPYEMFLSGSVSLLRIENPQNTSGRRLVIFRDSFGSSIAPLLVEGYSSVTLVDIRYLASSRLGGFVDFTGCDVLFLYSAGVLNNSSTLK